MNINSVSEHIIVCMLESICPCTQMLAAYQLDLDCKITELKSNRAYKQMML